MCVDTRGVSRKTTSLPTAENITEMERMGNLTLPGLEVFRYWDEAIDAGKFTSSVVFDSEYGFGGNGVQWGNDTDIWDYCIRDGPFENYMLHNGPGLENTRHCITRLINDEYSKLAGQDGIDLCMEMGTFAEAWPCIEGGPHRGGHAGVGGEMVRGSHPRPLTHPRSALASSD